MAVKFSIDECVSQERIDAVCETTFDDNPVHNKQVMGDFTLVEEKGTEKTSKKKPKIPAVPATLNESRVVAAVLAGNHIPQDYRLVSLESSFEKPLSSSQPFRIDIAFSPEDPSQNSLIMATAGFMGAKELYNGDLATNRDQKYGTVNLVFSKKAASKVRPEILDFYRKLNPLHQTIKDERISRFAEAVTLVPEQYQRVLYLLAASSGIINDGTKNPLYPALKLLRPDDEEHPETTSNIPVYVSRRISVRPEIVTAESATIDAHLTYKVSVANNFPELDAFPRVDVSIAAFQNGNMVYYMDTGILLLPKRFAAKLFMNKSD